VPPFTVASLEMTKRVSVYESQPRDDSGPGRLVAIQAVRRERGEFDEKGLTVIEQLVDALGGKSLPRAT